jgi:hypothetical protein
VTADAAWGEAPIPHVRDRYIAARWKHREGQWKCRVTSRDKLEPNLPTLDDLERDSAACPQQETTLGPLDGVRKHGVRRVPLAMSQEKRRMTRSADACVDFPEQIEHRGLCIDRCDIEPLDREPRRDRAPALARASRGPRGEFDRPAEPRVVRVMHYDAFQARGPTKRRPRGEER